MTSPAGQIGSNLTSLHTVYYHKKCTNLSLSLSASKALCKTVLSLFLVPAFGLNWFRLKDPDPESEESSVDLNRTILGGFVHGQDKEGFGRVWII